MTDTNDKIISFENVGKIYFPMKETALENVNFSVSLGEFVCMVGASGGGKTTILKIIAGLEKETSGKVTKPENVSMVFQSGAIFPWLSVFDNIAMPLEVKKIPAKKSGSEIRKIVDEQMQIMGLTNFAGKLPSELSGGQRQRVGIARALAVNPDVLLLDEPFSALDAKTTSELHTDLIKVWKETGKTIVMVSHLIEEAVSLSSKILLVKNKTVTHEFSVTFPYPRREQQEAFMSEVTKIRREFFN
jgi:ABC-type nitrate/sulfonate/bicarbonate transport system ATPase subunit